MRTEEDGPKITALGTRDRRALLDGGATHCLRKTFGAEEWGASEEVEVTLAQGKACLRQIPWTRTLITESDVQPLVPLGVLAEAGYSIKWEGKDFVMADPSGARVETVLVAGCPTVSEAKGLSLIREVEKYVLEQKARLCVLRGEALDGPLSGMVDQRTKGWLEKLRGLFPEVPEEVLRRLVPRGGYDPNRLPWNRRARKRLREAKEVVLHLYSGPDEKGWKELETKERAVLCVDLALGKDQDMHDDHILGYLFELCESGRVRFLLAGPPCRTVSRLRSSAPGPPPLRSREGECRFGLGGLSAARRRQVVDDTVLFMRTLGLYMVAADAASESGGGRVGLVLESPQDPETYSPSEPGEEPKPSFWAWKEWRDFGMRYGMSLVSFDQGPFGHERRKPTSLGANLDILSQLKEVRGPGEAVGLKDSLEQRMEDSRAWAAWAPGLKAALKVAIRVTSEEWSSGVVAARRLSREQWIAHLKNDHQPYRNECRTCLEAAGRSRPHRRVEHPRAFTLSIDLGGPYVTGRDQLGARMKYMVVGVYTVPVTKEGKRCLVADTLAETVEEASGAERAEAERLEEAGGDPERDGLPRQNGGAGDGADGEGDGLEVVAEKRRHEPEDLADDMAAWEKRIEWEEGVEVRQLTFVEAVESRHSSHILKALGKIYAKIRYLGLPVLRLHSDRAAELKAKPIKEWCAQRDLYRTFTDADSFKMNGRAEAEIGVLSRATRTLLLHAELPDEMWPLALRHAAERRLKGQLEMMKMPTQELLPFGSYGFARQKDWSEKTRAWRRARKKVRILGPDASINAGGYFVQTEDGQYFHTADVRLLQEVEAGDGDGRLPNLGDLREEKKEGPVEQDPRRRVYGKLPVEIRKLERASRNLEERYNRGRQMIGEEAMIREDYRPGGERSDGLLDLVIQENDGLETALRALGEVAQDAARGKCMEAGEWLQTVTVSNAEVRKELELWKPAFEKEYNSLRDTGVIQVVSEKDLRELEEEARASGRIFEVVPGKAVCTRKSPDGRRKARGVICGNFMAPREKEDLYASGCDVTALRSMIRQASLRKWKLASVDVSTAFLQVPPGQKKDTTVVVPPRLFREAGLVKEEDRWLVRGTLYGTITAPREWGDHRVDTLAVLRWGERKEWRLRKTLEPNLWEVVRDEEVCGHLAVYVDDLLTSGDESTVSKLLAAIGDTWKCSEAEWCGAKGIKFCGLEITAEGGGYRIHQESYIRSLLVKHQIAKGTAVMRYDLPEAEEDPSLESVRRAQALTGELQWVSGRTRPDVSHACSIMAQYATKAPDQVAKVGLEVLRYLAETPTLGIFYGPECGRPEDPGTLPFKRERNLIEVHCDAAFAQGGGKSMTGVVVFHAGAPVFWASMRQTVMTLSTAEAELSAQLEALVAGRSVRALVGCLEPGELQGIILNDNVAALSIAAGTSGSWRTRHLRIKAEGLREAATTGEWTLRHLDGRNLIADGLTKQLPGGPQARMIAGMQMVEESGPQVRAVRGLHLGVDAERLSGAVGLIAAMGCCARGVRAEDGEDAERLWAIILVVFMTAGYIIGECVRRLGAEGLKAWRGDESDVKVKVLREGAVVPVRGTDHAAGWDISSWEDATLEPGESRLLRTGLAMEMPKGTYGRLATRSIVKLRRGGGLHRARSD